MSVRLTQFRLEALGLSEEMIEGYPHILYQYKIAITQLYAFTSLNLLAQDVSY